MDDEMKERFKSMSPEEKAKLLREEQEKCKEAVNKVKDSAKKEFNDAKETAEEGGCIGCFFKLIGFILALIAAIIFGQ